MPAGAKILPYRSNVPKLSEFCFTVCDETFPQRARAAGRSIIVGGANYGQGSSREHAALVPMYLGVRAVAAKSFARIHAANLINYGILPLTFANADDYDRLSQGDELDHLRRLFGPGRAASSRSRTGRRARRSPSPANFRRASARFCATAGLLAYTKEGKQ